MQIILGIDAAWTAGEPSGVALIRRSGEASTCLAVSPSYDAFVALAYGKPVNWAQPHKGSNPDAVQLLDAARRIAGVPVDVVAVDMPMSYVPITGRRAADHEISCEFGARWCSAHTPSAQRPGPVGLALSAAFQAAGYGLATCNVTPSGRCLLEVYPHPALLALLRRDRRVPYKVSKSKRYWPHLNMAARAQALLAEFAEIERALAVAFGPVAIPLPESVKNLSDLKRYEDGLDALVCAWVGSEYVAGRTVPLGDSNAAIWCPIDVVRGRSLNGRADP